MKDMDREISFQEARLIELELELRTRLFKVRRIREVCRMADEYPDPNDESLQIGLVALANRIADDSQPKRRAF